MPQKWPKKEKEKKKKKKKEGFCGRGVRNRDKEGRFFFFLAALTAYRTSLTRDRTHALAIRRATAVTTLDPQPVKPPGNPRKGDFLLISLPIQMRRKPFEWIKKRPAYQMFTKLGPLIPRLGF